jgi:hypothetical protein
MAMMLHIMVMFVVTQQFFSKVVLKAEKASLDLRVRASLSYSPTPSRSPLLGLSRVQDIFTSIFKQYRLSATTASLLSSI